MKQEFRTIRRLDARVYAEAGEARILLSDAGPTRALKAEDQPPDHEARIEAHAERVAREEAAQAEDAARFRKPTDREERLRRLREYLEKKRGRKIT
jgi:hypothetical protein